MPRIEQTYPARGDLQQIWLYIAQENLTAAARLIDEIERLLAHSPLMGQATDTYRVGLRQFTVGNYVLFYQQINDGVRLVRVFHGARNLEDLFN